MRVTRISAPLVRSMLISRTHVVPSPSNRGQVTRNNWSDDSWKPRSTHQRRILHIPSDFARYSRPMNTVPLNNAIGSPLSGVSHISAMDPPMTVIGADADSPASIRPVTRVATFWAKAEGKVKAK